MEEWNIGILGFLETNCLSSFLCSVSFLTLFHHSIIPLFRLLYFSFRHLSNIRLISPLPLIKLGSKGNFPFKKSFTPGMRESFIKSLLLSIYSINMVTSWALPPLRTLWIKASWKRWIFFSFAVIPSSMAISLKASMRTPMWISFGHRVPQV